MTDRPAITAVPGPDISQLLAPAPGRRHRIDGFEELYVDFVDYIIRCTHRIWEQKQVGLIETHYSDDCLLHTPTGPIQGRDAVTGGTVKTLAGFPDRTLIGDAVIWDESPAGFLSSHRIVSHATNLGASDFGPATGRRATFITIADCLCRENRIVEEWLVRDNAAIVRALGFDMHALAKTQAAADRAASSEPVAPWRAAAMARVRDAAPSHFPGEGSLPDAETAPEEFARAVFDRVWSHRLFGTVRAAYACNARWRGSSNRRLFGWGEITGWIIALLGSFSQAKILIEKVTATPFDGGIDIGVRWTLAGRHDGPSLYGAPSGREVMVMAITHWRVVGGRIAEETQVIDEIAVLRQIEGGL